MHQQSSRAPDNIEKNKVCRKATKKDKTAAIYTGRRMTLDSLKNSEIHKSLIEEISKN